MTTLQPKTLSPYYYNSPFTSLLFENKSGDRTYCYGPKYESNEVVGPRQLSGMRGDAGEDRWFIFYVDDCAFPPMYAINARSWEDAYEIFQDECVHLIKIDDEDLKDYNCGELYDPTKSPCGFNSNGVPVVTEGVSGFEVWLKEARV